MQLDFYTNAASMRSGAIRKFAKNTITPFASKKPKKYSILSYFIIKKINFIKYVQYYHSLNLYIP